MFVKKFDQGSVFLKKVSKQRLSLSPLSHVDNRFDMLRMGTYRDQKLLMYWLWQTKST